MEKKEKTELLSKRADIINKKMLVLLATAGGSGAYAVKFLLDTEPTSIGYLFLLVFVLMGIGVFVSYTKLSEIEKEIKELENV
mgnify:CR=1 FL=1